MEERKEFERQDSLFWKSTSLQKLNVIIYSSPLREPEDYLHYVELRQQVAVGKSKLLAVQEGAGRGSEIIGAILVYLIRKWGAEVVVQLL